MTAVIEVDQLERTFGENRAVDGMTFHVKQGVLVLALVIGQVSGVLFLGVGTVLVIGTLIWLVDILLITLSVKNFKRSALIAKL
jgi:hypothetical protein